MKTYLITAFLSLSLFASAFASKPGWEVDYKGSLEKAKADNKLVLLDFTGSDWCGWCVKIDKDVFATDTFKEYASKNLVLVELDFPAGFKLPDNVAKQNDKLSKDFEVEGFPTIVLVDGNGKELKRWVGYEKKMFDQIKETVAENKAKN